MNDIQQYLDEDGVLHMCKLCRFILISGDPSKKIMITNLAYNPPDDINFVVCDKCSGNRAQFLFLVFPNFKLFE